MYNQKKPSPSDLPTPKQLVRSTLIAACVACFLLVIAVLPGEYGYDLTGIGKMLGLKKMGEIKVQLKKESSSSNAGNQSAGETVPTTESTSALASSSRSDSIRVSLSPDQGAEIKMAMREGAQVSYQWVSSGLVNHDTHAEGSGRSISYSKGRQINSDKGVLVAAFDGKHGWFWRNRGNAPVEVTLHVIGEFRNLSRVK
jgi:hypothetical protein